MYFYYKKIIHGDSTTYLKKKSGYIIMIIQVVVMIIESIVLLCVSTSFKCSLIFGNVINLAKWLYILKCIHYSGCDFIDNILTTCRLHI